MNYTAIAIAEPEDQVTVASPKTIAYVPQGYIVNETGVFKVEDDGNLPICDRLYINALARDDNGSEWGRLAVWWDQDGRKHEWAMPNSMLAGDGADYRRHMLSNGLMIRGGRKAQNALHDYIMACTPSDRALSVGVPGWHKNRYIALDGTAYGQGTDRILLQVAGAVPQHGKSGCLQSWQETVARYASGNSRLILAVSSAFAGILLLPGNEGSGGFHFSGGSSTGKTTTLRMAASVWGAPMRSWRTTDNAAESWARFANDGFLAIDELGQVDGKAADQMAYMLGNGQTKGRANRDGIAKETADFRLMFLSTGEIGLADKLEEGKKKAKAGQTVRMIEIPADAGEGMGIFEDLHGFQTGDEFAKHLRQATEDNKGQAVGVFLNKLVALDPDQRNKAISELTDRWLKENVPAGADGQIQRVGRRFALVAVAGELAASFGILPWADREASNAAARCFKDWLKERGGTDSYEALQGIKDILTFIERYSSSRFDDKDVPSGKIHDRAGFWSKKPGGEIEYMIFPDVLRSEILGGSKNTEDILKLAIKLRLVEPDGSGKSSKPVTLPAGLGKKRMICVFPARYTGELPL